MSAGGRKAAQEEEFSFDGVGGVKIFGNLIPPGDATQVSEIILCHHGLWADASFPPFQDRLVRSLAREDRIVIAYDARGHGRSCRDSVTGEFRDYFDVDAMVTDVTLALNFVFSKFSLIDRKGLRTVVVGHSLGGYVALRAAAGDPRISQVITVSSPMSFHVVRRVAPFKDFMEALIVDIPQRIHDGIGDKGPISIMKFRARNAREAEKKFLSAPPIHDFAGKISCPVTFLIGEEDVLIEIFDTRKETREVSAMIPSSSIASVPGEHAFLGVEDILGRLIGKEIGEKGKEWLARENPANWPRKE